MGIQDCIQNVKDAAPNLTDDEAMDLLQFVSDVTEQKRADRNVADLNAAVEDAVRRRAEDIERAALQEKREAALRYRVRVRQRGKINDLLRAGSADDIADFLEAITVGKAGDSRFKESIERTGEAINAQAHALFMAELRVRGVDEKEAVKFLRNKEAGRLLIMEADNPGSTGNKLAKAVAESMNETQEYLRKTANRYGASIGKMDGYLIKQGHDSDAMERAGKESWVDRTMPLLDHDRTFGPDMGDAGKRKFLSKAFDNIILGKPADLAKDLSAPPGFTGPRNMGKKLSSRRSLHFKKDGESAWLYMQEFGNTDVGSTFAFGMDGMSRAIGSMIHLGPNPEYMLDDLIKYAKNQMRDNISATRKIESREKTIKGLYREISGEGGRLPSNMDFAGKLARTTNWTKNLTGAGLLGGVTLASIADIGTAATRLKGIGIPFFEAHGSVLSSLSRGRGNVETREIAQSLGVGVEGLISDVQAKWMGNDNGNGQGAFLVGAVMRVTGMNWLQDSFKTSVGLTLSNYLARSGGKGFDALHPNLRRELEAYGIDAAQWDHIREARRTMEDKDYIDPRDVKNEDAQRRFREFIRGFADSAILTPGARTRYLTRNILGSGERGDPLTEISVLFTHLKSFSIAYFQEHLSRFHRKGDGIQYAYAAHLTLSALVYGYIAGSLKDIAAGREPRDLRDTEKLPAILGDAWLTGGGAGFYGDLIFAMVDEKKLPGRGILESTAGPGLGMLFSAGRVASEAMTGDATGAFAEASRMVKTVTPGANIFYTRLVADYMLWWPMAEYIRPGYARRVERRAREDRGHEYIAGPVSAAQNSPLLN